MQLDSKFKGSNSNCFLRDTPSLSTIRLQISIYSSACGPKFWFTHCVIVASSSDDGSHELIRCIAGHDRYLNHFPVLGFLKGHLLSKPRQSQAPSLVLIQETFLRCTCIQLACFIKGITIEPLLKKLYSQLLSCL